MPQEYNSLTLAYLGDSVFELFVRERLVTTAKTKPTLLHKEAIKIVNAKTQAKIMQGLELTESELQVAKRAKNAKFNRPLKNSLADYKLATAFEAVLGHLYLSGEKDRLEELCQKALEIIDL